MLFKPQISTALYLGGVLGGVALGVWLGQLSKRKSDDKKEASTVSRPLARSSAAPARSSSQQGDGYAGRVVLVTGASAGIGREIALQLAAQGAALALQYNTGADRAAEVVAACLAAGAARAEAFQCDLSSSPAEAAAGLVQRVLQSFGRIDVLVNNSGAFLQHEVSVSAACTGGGLPVCDAGQWAEWQAVWDRTLALNLSAPAHLSYLVAHHMIARWKDAKSVGANPYLPAATAAASSSSSSSRSSSGSATASTASASATAAAAAAEVRTGAIVMVGSRGAFRGEPRAWAYGASKAGLHQLAQSMAAALGPFGVSVTAVAPGFVETAMARRSLDGPAGAAIRGQSPWDRVATVGEVAQCVLFLGAYWRLPWISGAILDCNGASYLRT